MRRKCLVLLMFVVWYLTQAALYDFFYRNPACYGEGFALWRTAYFALSHAFTFLVSFLVYKTAGQKQFSDRHSLRFSGLSVQYEVTDKGRMRLYLGLFAVVVILANVTIPVPLYFVSYTVSRLFLNIVDLFGFLTGASGIHTYPFIGFGVVHQFFVYFVTVRLFQSAALCQKERKGRQIAAELH